MSSNLKDDKNEQNKPLIEIFHNPVAGTKAFNSYISFGDVLNDGSNRLTILDTNNNLKVFKGEVLQAENHLSVIASGIVTYYSIDKYTKQKISFLAVAGGTYIYVYKNLKGYIKIPIPNVEPNHQELLIYSKYLNGRIDAKTCLIELNSLNDKLNGNNEEENEENDVKNEIENKFKTYLRLCFKL